MAIGPRCVLATNGGSGTATSISPGLTGWTNAGVSGISGTAPAAGDLVIITGIADASGKTVTQTGPDAWTIHGSDSNSGGGVTSFAAFRVFDGTESTPTFSWSGATAWSYVIMAVAPDSGNTCAVDVWATTKIDQTTAATTHTANAATVTSGNTDCSLILAAWQASAVGSRAGTQSAPTGWTLPTAAKTFANSTSGDGNDICYKQSCTGTQTPGAETIEGGSSTTGPTFANLYHVLVTQTASAVNGTVTGVTADVAVDAPAGTAAGDGNVTGTAAAVSIDAPAGTAAGTGGGSGSVTGVTAAVAVAAPAGTPAGSASVTGITAPVAVAAPAGTPSGSANVTGVSAHIAVAGGPGTPAGSAAVTGTSAAVAVAAPAGTPSGTANVAGTTALVNVAAPAGTAAGTGGGGATVTGVAAAVAVAAPAGTASGSASVAGVTASVLVTAGLGTLAASARVAGVTALVAVLGQPGTAAASGPFTVGVLTAADTSLAVLTGASTSATLTAGDSGFTGGYPGTYTPAYPAAASGTLTASDQKAGGPA